MSFRDADNKLLNLETRLRLIVAIAGVLETKAAELKKEASSLLEEVGDEMVEELKRLLK